MAKKIKHFKLENFKPEELQKIEDDINAFIDAISLLKGGE